MMYKSLAVAALSAALMLAQGGPGRPGPGGPGGTPPSPEQMVERRVEFLTNYLSLTPSQVTQAKTIFTDEQKAADALRTPMQNAHTALENAVKANATDPQIEAAAAEIGKLQGQAAAIHAKAQAKFRAILTAEQKTKLDSMPGGHGGGPGGPMNGPGMRRGSARF